ncbi:hypothetical protein B0H15DRAFT_151690 [Mycena belliarum]|uniref:Fungal-type protein kinase domain-containing protein n=1 Tax=Mycena belliarum TaxID=1033014 RepID=A0AAD6XTD3_9AGAR|nr:hypothetical protein B0H15DRAFT_151690 [Mycena belliae]
MINTIEIANAAHGPLFCRVLFYARVNLSSPSNPIEFLFKLSVLQGSKGISLLVLTRRNISALDPMPQVFVSGVPLEFFFDFVLPCVTELAAQVEELLGKDRHIDNGNWTPLHPSTPCGSSLPLGRGTELSVIAIFDKVVLVGESVWQRPPNARLVDSLTSPVSACRPPPPDAQIRLVSPDFDSNSCFATAVPCKLKSMRNPEESNERELHWSCQDVLRDDPRRRFTFGISLDDTDLRIWFFSRSHELVTPPLNYLEEAPRLVQLFLALAFASQEELGYDESMTSSRTIAVQWQYKIQVGEAFYVTTKLLSDHRRDAAYERRVFGKLIAKTILSVLPSLSKTCGHRLAPYKKEPSF